MNLFDYDCEKITIKNPIRLIELFGGIGSQAKALKNLGADFEHYVLCEFDKYAIQSYNAIHGTDFKTSDIRQLKGEDLKIVDIENYTYLLTYSFPCQDLSKAGKGNGMDRDSGTRSGLLWEVERLLNETDNLPQILLMENVPDVMGTKNVKHFAEWIDFLESKGYKCYYQCLNAKNYGVAQNRDRCFMVSILGDYYYEFPQSIKLEKRLKDYLEPIVDEKYYISKKMLEYIIADNEKWTGNNNASLINKEIASTINTKEGCRRCDASNFISDNIDEIGGIDLKSGGVHIPEATKKGYAIANEGDGVYINRPEQKRGCVQKGVIQTIKTSCTDIGVVVNSADGYMVNQSDSFNVGPLKDCARTLQANNPNGAVLINNLRRRKLTPLECFRLMGFDDEDYYKCKEINVSNSQLYKQAGNSIVVNVLMAIFKQLSLF